MRRWKGVHLTAEWRTNSSSLMVTKSHMLVILPSITNSTKTYVYTNISLRSVAVAIGVECSSEPSFCHRTTYEWSKSESYNAVPYAYVSVMRVLYVQDWQRGCLFIMIHFDMDLQLANQWKKPGDLLHITHEIVCNNKPRLIRNPDSIYIYCLPLGILIHAE